MKEDIFTTDCTDPPRTQFQQSEKPWNIFYFGQVFNNN